MSTSLKQLGSRFESCMKIKSEYEELIAKLLEDKLIFMKIKTTMNLLNNSKNQ